VVALRRGERWEGQFLKLEVRGRRRSAGLGDNSVSSCRSYTRGKGPGVSAGAFPMGLSADLEKMIQWVCKGQAARAGATQGVQWDPLDPSSLYAVMLTQAPAVAGPSAVAGAHPHPPAAGRRPAHSSPLKCARRSPFTPPPSCIDARAPDDWLGSTRGSLHRCVRVHDTGVYCAIIVRSGVQYILSESNINNKGLGPHKGSK
jgi:hypothetical protein